MKLRIKKTTVEKLVNFIAIPRTKDAIVKFLVENGMQNSDYIQSRYREVLSFFYDPETMTYMSDEKTTAALNKAIAKG